MKESIEELLKAFVARFRENKEDDSQFSRERLKQLQEKYKIEDLPDADHFAEAEEKCEVDGGSFAFDTAEERQSGVVRWCGNADRFMDQKIRAHNELGGQGQLFEIDPMEKLPD